MRRSFSWHARPGLAGGIDKDGLQAEALLSIGFGSVEFGSLMPDSQTAVAARLSAVHGRWETAIGAGIGLPPEWPADALAAVWMAGLNALWPMLDYLSFNLSAAANRRFLQTDYLPFLQQNCQALIARRDQLAASSGRYLPLALKLPLSGGDEALPGAATIAAAAGFDQLTLVLPDDAGRFVRFKYLCDVLEKSSGPPPVLLAVGGIRCAADVLAARQAGAAGVQVHRLFVEQGANCLLTLQAQNLVMNDF